MNETGLKIYRGYGLAMVKSWKHVLSSEELQGYVGADFAGDLGNKYTKP